MPKKYLPLTPQKIKPMKKIILATLLIASFSGWSQAGAPANPYYNGFDFTLTGMALKNALATKITNTHTHLLTYAEAENAIRYADLDPTDNTHQNIFLVYGYSPEICPVVSPDNTAHRRRDKDDDGTGGCQWNREHTYAKSLGNPDLGTDGPGSDAHHIRPADVSRNDARGSRKFTTGSGNSGVVGAYWYPGDEWKGDIARMMMYMYLRYGTQCLPKNVGVGNVLAIDANMIDLFLQWNADDPVSAMEDQRNTYLGNANNFYGQGNRNPFIDNPYLATRIWGGPVAQNRWPNVFLANESFDWYSLVSVSPNPSSNGQINISSPKAIDSIQIIALNGQIVSEVKNPTALTDDHQYALSNLPRGFYLLKLNIEDQVIIKKIAIQ